MQPNHKQWSCVAILRIMLLQEQENFLVRSQKCPASTWHVVGRRSVNICCMDKLTGRGTRVERAQVMAEGSSELKSVLPFVLT